MCAHGGQVTLIFKQVKVLAGGQPVLCVGADGGTPFIAMEHVEGGSLRPLIGDLTVQRVGRVLEDLLAAVGHSARAGIVHRDLKPENALLSKDGRIKVADFGIAKAAGPDSRA